MNFDDNFINLIQTMYSEVTLHFNINGVIDPIATKPGNGIAQGCPASPCLYLLCIPGLISLIKRDQLRKERIKGIQVPGPKGEDAAATANVSCFADDLQEFLKSR